MNPRACYSNILLRVPNWLGDSMMASPLVEVVHQTFPQARLTILAKPNLAPFWRDFSKVNEVLVLEKGLAGYLGAIGEMRKRKFDVALCLPSSFSSALMLWGAGIPRRVGWGGEGREFLLTEVIANPLARQKHLVWEYLELVRWGLGQPIGLQTFHLSFPVNTRMQREALKTLKFLKAESRFGLVALGPGATYGPAKRWTLNHWKDLMIRLLESGKETLLVVGGPEEKDYLSGLWKNLPGPLGKRLVSLVGKTNPLELAAILKSCKLFITNDTGPMHVAAAVGIPTIGLFGSTSPSWTRPFGIGHEVIYKAVECSPCYQKTCPIGYLCLDEITVEEVYQKAQEKLKSFSVVRGEKVPKGLLD